GEHSATVRSLTLAQLGLFGVVEDAAANAAHGAGAGCLISAAGSTPVLVVPTDEELMIAQDTRELTR
ncbi:MAG: acetate kinase, partial [Pseudonocardiales bacterium]|nr:acetate kinase [Pseudonocardiales bacterium]